MIYLVSNWYSIGIKLIYQKRFDSKFEPPTLLDHYGNSTLSLTFGNWWRLWAKKESESVEAPGGPDRVGRRGACGPGRAGRARRLVFVLMCCIYVVHIYIYFDIVCYVLIYVAICCNMFAICCIYFAICCYSVAISQYIFGFLLSFNRSISQFFRFGDFDQTCRFRCPSKQSLGFWHRAPPDRAGPAGPAGWYLF